MSFSYFQASIDFHSFDSWHKNQLTDSDKLHKLPKWTLSTILKALQTDEVTLYFCSTALEENVVLFTPLWQLHLRLNISSHSMIFIW